jgi:hypothetical protein
MIKRAFGLVIGAIQIGAQRYQQINGIYFSLIACLQQWRSDPWSRLINRIAVLVKQIDDDRMSIIRSDSDRIIPVGWKFDAHAE